MKIVSVRLERDNSNTTKITTHDNLADTYEQIERYRKAYYRKSDSFEYYEMRLQITFEDGFIDTSALVFRTDIKDRMIDPIDTMIHVAEMQAHGDWVTFDNSQDTYFLDLAKKSAKFARYLKEYKLAYHNELVLK